MEIGGGFVIYMGSSYEAKLYSMVGTGNGLLEE
jgi:predicted Zn-dependent protease